MKVSKDALSECKRLKQNDFFYTIKRNAISGDTVTVPVHNVRSLPRYEDDNYSKWQ